MKHYILNHLFASIAALALLILCAFADKRIGRLSYAFLGRQTVYSGRGNRCIVTALLQAIDSRYLKPVRTG